MIFISQIHIAQLYVVCSICSKVSQLYVQCKKTNGDSLISWISMKRRKKYETKNCKNVRCEGGEQYFINDGRQTSLFALMRDGVSVDDISESLSVQLGH